MCCQLLVSRWREDIWGSHTNGESTSIELFSLIAFSTCGVKTTRPISLTTKSIKTLEQVEYMFIKGGIYTENRMISKVHTKPDRDDEICVDGGEAQRCRPSLVFCIIVPFLGRTTQWGCTSGKLSGNQNVTST